MRRSFILISLLLFLSACGPTLVWNGDEATRGRLLEIVPLGSSLAALQSEAQIQGWPMENHDNRAFEKGTPHYFGGRGEHQGGVRRYKVVAEYGIIFTTSVETVWLFDEHGELGELCIRRTTDAI